MTSYFEFKFKNRYPVRYFVSDSLKYECKLILNMENYSAKSFNKEKCVVRSKLIPCDNNQNCARNKSNWIKSEVTIKQQKKPQ